MPKHIMYSSVQCPRDLKFLLMCIISAITNYFSLNNQVLNVCIGMLELIGVINECVAILAG